MVHSYSMALFAVRQSNEAMAGSQLDLAIATDTKEESIIAKMPSTTATAQVRESFIFKVSSEFEGNLKTREIDDFLAIKSGSFVKIVNSLYDCLYSY